MEGTILATGGPLNDITNFNPSSLKFVFKY